jgi:hypothetical protein
MIPDTQNDVAISTETFSTQCEWIVNNYSDKKSSTVVVHVGDIVNDGILTQSWINAVDGLNKIKDAEIPMLITPGNHDYLNSDYNQRLADNYNLYIDYSDFYTSHGWFDGGSYSGTSENVYFKLTIQGIKYIFVNLENSPRGEVMHWAENIIRDNSDYQAIILTHDYMWGTAFVTVVNDRTSVGDSIWYTIGKGLRNLKLILCGHYWLTARRTDFNYFGNAIPAILYDMQHVTGKGWLRILTIDDTAKTISVESYSVIDDEYDTSEDFQFTMDYDYDLTMSTPNTLGTNIFTGLNMEGITPE